VFQVSREAFPLVPASPRWASLHPEILLGEEEKHESEDVTGWRSVAYTDYTERLQKCGSYYWLYIIYYIIIIMSLKEEITPEDTLSFEENPELGLFLGHYSNTIFAALKKTFPNNIPEADIQDCIQDAIIKVCRKQNTYDSTKGSLISWILTIAGNTMRDQIRKKLTQERTITPLWALSVNNENTADMQSPDSIVASREIYEFLCTLPETERRCMILIMQWYTYKEIFTEVGITKGKLTSILKNSRGIFSQFRE
jgi:RNA polymerase sigma factor (sigma-70 family)